MQEISLDVAIEDFVNYKLSKLYTALPCRIVAIRSSLEDQRVDLQPLTNRKLKDGSPKEQPTILNVPVIFPASKKASVTFPIDVGDTVLCVYSQRSLDAFKASTGARTYTPQSNRRFDITDAIAIPGLFPFADAPNNPAKRKWTHSTRDVVIANNLNTANENEIRLKDTGDIEFKTDQNFYATFADGLIECNNLVINASGDVDIVAGGDITLNSINTVMDSTANTSIIAGADLSLDAATWTVTVNSTTTVNCPITNWTGAFNLTGTLAATGGDVTADTISLKTHVHSNPEGGTVGPPQ